MPQKPLLLLESLLLDTKYHELCTMTGRVSPALVYCGGGGGGGILYKSAPPKLFPSMTESA